jgi:hypothetical protein
MQFPGSSRLSSPGHSGLKRSFAQQATAHRLAENTHNSLASSSSSKDSQRPGKVPKIFRSQSPSSLTTSHLDPTPHPAPEMARLKPQRRESRSLRTGTHSAPGSRSSSRVHAKRKVPPKTAFEGPFWNKAEIFARYKSNEPNLAQLKESHELTPKSTISNWVHTVTGKLPNFASKEGVIDIDDRPQNIFRLVLFPIDFIISWVIYCAEQQYLFLKSTLMALETISRRKNPKNSQRFRRYINCMPLI